jgi:hypothetical protein
LPSLFNRFAIALQSLRNHFVIILQSLCPRFSIALPSLCNHFVITLQSLRNHFAVALQSLCDRLAIFLQSLCYRFAIALLSLYNRLSLTTISHSLSHSPSLDITHHIHSAEQKVSIVNAFSGPILKNNGENVIVQGDNGDTFYLLEDGTVDVWIKKKNQQEAEAVKVHTYESGK